MNPAPPSVCTASSAQKPIARVAKVFVPLAEEIPPGPPARDESQRRSARAPPAHLLQRGAQKAGPVALEEKQGNAASPRPAGPHRNRVVVGAYARRDERLLAIDDV